MTETILTNPSDEELAAAVQENLYALFRAMATLPGGELVESEKQSHHLAFPSNPMYKGVWRTRLSLGEADNVIDETIEWFKARNAPFLFWWTGPGTTPDDLGERLVARGFVSMEAQLEHVASSMKFAELGAPGMVADLHHMNEATLTHMPSGFTIEEVQDEAALYDFKRVLIEGYEIPEGMAHGWVQAALGFGIGRTPWKMVLGKLNGEPVATHLLFNGAGVAGVYGVASVPSARGKVIGGAITLKPLLEARDIGYHYSVLFSTEMGIHAYERIGFRDCGVRINRYLWRNA